MWKNLGLSSRGLKVLESVVRPLGQATTSTPLNERGAGIVLLAVPTHRTKT